MQALVYEGPKIMNMRELQVPQLLEDEVLIKVEVAGICGSELSGYLGHNSLRKPPLVMGHEFAGSIEKLGVGVKRIALGDRVTVNPLITCRVCRYCLSGESQLCPNRQLLGAHRPGAFAEYIAVPERNVYKLPENLSYEQGAFVEPFACAVHLCRIALLTPRDRLVIYGAGPIGLFVLQTAHVYGVRNVVVVDLNESRLEIAAELGATVVTNIEKAVGSSLGSFDVAIDAVGAGVTRQLCIKAVRPGGIVIFTGLHEAEATLPINDMIRSEIVTKGAFAYSTEDFETALEWIGQERVNLLPWTEQYPIAEGGACFDKLISGPGKVAKILLKP
ncbi:alcohol dehydrogenase [Paenibacillus psychroresistens]|uniref:Alcohol dehydrogenase n=2 Tax=Paenibacillus psychroresistens TaxID=1778678 RepID=A0A6B8RXJ6_9BACL|nr:alcohol dehydrogenase [Paenibacillus psychroresistens]